MATLTSTSPTGTKSTAPPRLTGRAFYESIGSPKYVLAPMVDQSEFAWRMLVRSYLAPGEQSSLLCYTPMLHARLYAETPKYRTSHFEPTRAQASNADIAPLLSAAEPASSHTSSDAVPHLDGNPLLDRPLLVQFCANEPSSFLQAATLVAPHCDGVDLNLGCPQGIARKGRYGAFLQESQDLISSLISTVASAPATTMPVPVTAKIRVLDDPAATLAYAQRVISAGASILAVHGRMREQKGHLTGLADWAAIRRLRDALPPEVVLFANGNVLCHEDLERCRNATGADAVLSAEGALSNPGIFARPPMVGEEGREFWRGVDGKGGWRVDGAMRRYVDILWQYCTPQGRPPVARRPLWIPADRVLPGETSVTVDVDYVNEEGPARKKQKLDSNYGICEENELPSNNNSDMSCSTDALQQRDKQPIIASMTTTTTTTAQPATTGKLFGNTRSKLKHSTSPNLTAAQAHLFSLLRHLVTRHTDIRDILARLRAGDMDALERILAVVERRCAEGIREYTATGGESWRREEQELDEKVVRKLKGAGGSDGGPVDGNDGGGRKGGKGGGTTAIAAAVEEPSVVEPPPLPTVEHANSGGQTLVDKEAAAAVLPNHQSNAITCHAAVADQAEATSHPANGNDALSHHEEPSSSSSSSSSRARHSAVGAPREHGEQDGQDARDDTHSSLAALRRCRRPWWVCQPIIRPLPAEALVVGSVQARKAKTK